jgi:two-component system NtrC family sensor kinase
MRDGAGDEKPDVHLHHVIAAMTDTILPAIDPGNVLALQQAQACIGWLSALAHQLRQREKLVLMGSLLAGVAHELNNPLTIVMGRAAMLEEQTHGTPLHDEARRVVEAAQRCGRIVRTFLNMARQRKPSRGTVRLNELVRAVADMLGYLLRSHGVQLQLQLCETLPDAHGDADQLGQVVLNLLVNAQQALADAPPPRRVQVSTGSIDAAPADGRGQLWLRVSDNGPGVPQELAEHVFSPFFTTKAEGTGTGLGLSMCRAVAREHGGDVVLEPVAAGASFLLWVPLGGPHD